MRSFVRDHVLSTYSISRQIFRAPELERVIGEHESRRHNHEKLIWTLVNLELFQEQFHLA
jgi:asparagine synthase (glutamine-hydrolysing)